MDGGSWSRRKKEPKVKKRQSVSGAGSRSGPKSARAAENFISKQLKQIDNKLSGTEDQIHKERDQKKVMAMLGSKELTALSLKPVKIGKSEKNKSETSSPFVGERSLPHYS